jgi:hypothetical protein
VQDSIVGGLRGYALTNDLLPDCLGYMITVHVHTRIMICECMQPEMTAFEGADKCEPNQTPQTVEDDDLLPHLAWFSS